MSHECHIQNCDKKVRPEMLMCKFHWAMVPQHLKKPVLENYKKGQCESKRPTKSWIIAARNAMAHVLIALGELDEK